MAQQVISGSVALAEKIRHRRKELGLTIEEAASRAGVGTKTWCRYEGGESIRKDKARGVCKALNWTGFPDQKENDDVFSVEEYRDHKAWSSFLKEAYGVRAALSFAVGSDLLYDELNEDMEALAKMPKGSHLGQLDISWLFGDLPEQFLMNYDYEFLYRMRCTLINLRMRASAGVTMIAHSVLEELIFYLCNEEANAFLELIPVPEGTWGEDDNEDWVFDMFDDADIITFLFSNVYLDENNPYHFSHWEEMQFYTNQG